MRRGRRINANSADLLATAHFQPSLLPKSLNSNDRNAIVTSTSADCEFELEVNLLSSFLRFSVLVFPFQNDIPPAIDARIETPGYYGGGLGFGYDGRARDAHPG